MGLPVQEQGEHGVPKNERYETFSPYYRTLWNHERSLQALSAARENKTDN